MRDDKGLLLSDLSRYRDSCQEARRKHVDQFIEFVQKYDNCCSRSLSVGHCTGSAFITDPDGSRVLLLFHPKLERWIQPGGHADDNFDLFEVARREAEEETGLAAADLSCAGFLKREDPRPCPYDLDIHKIPGRGSEVAHLHYDLRFLFVTDPGLPLFGETPELQLEWVPIARVQDRTSEESVLRMVDKLQLLPRDQNGKLGSLDIQPIHAHSEQLRS